MSLSILLLLLCRILISASFTSGSTHAAAHSRSPVESKIPGTTHAATNSGSPVESKIPGTTHTTAHSGLPTDANIRYIGRWDTSSNVIHTSYWPGAYFKTNFTGTTVKIRLATSVNIYVSIDGGVDTYYRNVKGTVNLTPTPLANGTHSLRVASPGEQDTIQFQGLMLDPGATTMTPTLSSQLIEFIGDSITAGATDSQKGLSDYAWLVGEQLHVEHTQIAQSGICLIDNVRCSLPASVGIVGMNQQFFKMQTVYFPNSPDWDFSHYQASAVVINLGTNDARWHLSDTAFQLTYTTFLQRISSVYPHAVIFAMRPFNGSKEGPIMRAVQAVNKAGYINIHYIDTTGWLSATDFNGLHPNDAGQVKAADNIEPILKAFLAFEPKIAL
jgi:GDSL-like Lipase/Acylhydrolase family/Carbohydrate esterase 2 N-terminal